MIVQYSLCMYSAYLIKYCLNQLHFIFSSGHWYSSCDYPVGNYSSSGSCILQEDKGGKVSTTILLF